MEVHIGEMERKSLKKSKGQHSAKTTAENSKQIFPEKELRGLSPNFHDHVYVRDLNIPTIDLPILLQETADRSWEYINHSQTHEYGEAEQFTEKEYINGIFLAVHSIHNMKAPWI